MARLAAGVQRRLEEIREDRVVGEVTYGKWQNADIIVRRVETGYRVVAKARGRDEITIGWRATQEEAEKLAIRVTQRRAGV